MLVCILVCFEAERKVRETGHPRSFEGGQAGQGSVRVSGEGRVTARAVPPSLRGQARSPPWVGPVPMELLHQQRGCLGLGTPPGPGDRPAWKAGGRRLRQGSVASCCVMLGKVCPSLSFSFPPGKMRQQAPSHPVSASPAGRGLGRHHRIQGPLPPPQQPVRGPSEKHLAGLGPSGLVSLSPSFPPSPSVLPGSGPLSAWGGVPPRGPVTPSLGHAGT